MNGANQKRPGAPALPSRSKRQRTFAGRKSVAEIEEDVDSLFGDATQLVTSGVDEKKSAAVAGTAASSHFDGTAEKNEPVPEPWKFWEKGMRCNVIWDDEQSYPAEVKAIDEKKAQVYFLQYGLNDTVEVDVSRILPFQPASRDQLAAGTPVWAIWCDDGIMYKAEVRQVLYGDCVVNFTEFETEVQVDFKDLILRAPDPEGEAQKAKPFKSKVERRPQIRCGSHSIQGYIRGDSTKVNQDCRIELFSIPSLPSASLFGVLDGHGPKGHKISQEVSKRISEMIGKQKQRLLRSPRKHLSCLIDDVVAHLRSVQTAIQSGIARGTNAELNAFNSGTTAVMTLKLRDRLYTANVGDSRGILCRLSSSAMSDSKHGPKSEMKTSSTVQVCGLNLEVVALSKDHKPDDPKEKKRITKAGGEVRVLPGPNQPPRVFGGAGAGRFGLAVSRSIGDFALHPYVIADPDFTEYKISENDLFAVWASDGIWEHMGNEEVARMIVESAALKKNGDLDAAARDLCNRARECWRGDTDGAYQDDITCVIAQFNETPDHEISVERIDGRPLSRTISDGVASTSTEVL